MWRELRWTSPFADISTPTGTARRWSSPTKAAAGRQLMRSSEPESEWFYRRDGKCVLRISLFFLTLVATLTWSTVILSKVEWRRTEWQDAIGRRPSGQTHVGRPRITIEVSVGGTRSASNSPGAYGDECGEWRKVRAWTPIQVSTAVNKTVHVISGRVRNIALSLLFL